jgi:hypothetical protein
MASWRGAAIGALTVGAAAHGVSRGMNSMNFNDNFYQAVTGDPNIDEEVFGTEVGVRELLMPLRMPIPFTRGIDFSQIGQMRQGGLGGLTAAVSGGFINAKSVGDHFKNANDPYLTRYNNRPPKVDGSIVFGMDKSKFGA